MNRANFIREWRESRGIKQQALAERLNVSQSYLSAIERGAKRYNQTIIETVAAALGCDPADLLAGPPNRSIARLEQKLREIPDISAREAGRIYVNEAVEEKQRLMGVKRHKPGASVSPEASAHLRWTRDVVVAAAESAGFPPEADVDFVATMMTRLAGGEISEEAVTDAFRFYGLGKKPKGGVR